MRSPGLTDPGEPQCGQWSRVSDAVPITLIMLINRANSKQFSQRSFLFIAGRHTPGSLWRGLHQLKDALEECGRVRNSFFDAGNYRFIRAEAIGAETVIHSGTSQCKTQ